MKPEIEIEKPVKKTEKSTIEVWFSTAFREHSVIVRVPTETDKGIKNLPKCIVFDKWKYSLDLSTEEGKAISEGLKASGRDGIDLFILGPEYPGEDIKERLKLMEKLNNMTAAQLREMIKLQDYIDADIPANTDDVDALRLVVLNNASL